MPGRRRATATGPTPVESLTHDDKRVNIPTADAHEFLDAEASKPAQLRYPRDSSLDPQLVWRGKDEQDAEDLVIDAPPIYIQEKIDPRVLIENLRRTAEKPYDEPELTLFDDFDGLQGWETVEFYQHPANWSNRMILGDSLQAMGSLAEKENLRGKVQMIYMDPPYGIGFRSNWQASTEQRDVKDGQYESTTREVEQIKAFRDTWNSGINSYLAYLRDRLTVARDLLAESGSVFVQIGDENIHLVRSVLDEVFGDANFVSMISFTKAAGGLESTSRIAGRLDYLLWYGKSIQHLKYRPLFERRLDAIAAGFTSIEFEDGVRRPLTKAERDGQVTLSRGDRLFRPISLTKPGPGSRYVIQVNGKSYDSGKRWWGSPKQSVERLISLGRVAPFGNTLRFVSYEDDFPLKPLSNLWDGLVGASDPIYVVQTNTKVVERCLLMTTDPGDLAVDPTCGSGTTAFVAETWGRRWITVDTSRVSIALARQRLMGSQFPFYLLADSVEGRTKKEELAGQEQPPTSTTNDLRKGFVYEQVPHVTLSAIANNPDIADGMSRDDINKAIARHAETEILYDQPYEDKRRVRVSGPFTVEGLSPHRAVSLDVEEPESETAATREADTASFEQAILDNLLKAGVQNGRKKERMKFESLVPYAGRLIQAEGVRKNGGADAPQRIGVSIGPQYGTVGIDWMKDVVREALRGEGFDLLLVLAFSFDPQAITKAEEFKRLPILPVRMNADLAMGESLLKKTGSANLFMVFGAPDVHIQKTPDGLIVEILGIDVYNPTTGEVRSDDTSEIALWMIDTDYNEESFFVRHCYFTGGNDPYARLKKALKADINEDAWASLYATRSRLFPRPESGKIAVKVINHYGDEVLKVYDV